MEAKLRLTGLDLPGGLVHREPYLAVLAVSQNTERGAQPSIYPIRAVEEDHEKPAAETDSAPVEVLHQVDLDVPIFEGDPGDWLVLSLAVVDSDKGVDYAVRRVDESRHAWDRTHFSGILGTGEAVAGNAVLPAADDAMGMLADTLANHGDVVMARFSLNLSGVEAFRGMAGESARSIGGATLKFSLVAEGLPEPETKKKAGGVLSGGDPAAKPAPTETTTTSNPGSASPPAAVQPGASVPLTDHKTGDATPAIVAQQHGEVTTPHPLPAPSVPSTPQVVDDAGKRKAATTTKDPGSL